MTPERAIDILTPGATRFSPPEYDEALELAREALRYYDTHSVGEEIMREGEKDDDKTF